MLSTEHVLEFSDDIWGLYLNSFSDIEKIPRENIQRTFGRGGDLMSFSDEGEFVGMAFTFSEDSTVFWVYFATVPEMRSKGYGSKIIGLIRDAYPGKDVFLVLEPCIADAEDYEMRVRRHGFYLRNGCRDTGVSVISDDYPFDTMVVQGDPSAEDMVRTVERYEDIHNGRA